MSVSFELPAPARFLQRSDQRNGWSDHYGALQVAHAYAGIPMHEGYFSAIWQHGCFGPWQDHSPHLLAFNSPRARELPILVARKDQVQLLQAGGYTNARAIGLPIIYTPSPQVSRSTGSLLIFPTHTLTGETYPDKTPFEAYAREIAAQLPHFREAAVCIHPSCLKNGLWLKEFGALGIPMIEGASTDDANALRRMRTLFERFDTVTTNGWGSHVAYALAFGAKVAIYGTKPDRLREHFEKDGTWNADKKALERALSDEQVQAERGYLEKLYREPRTAVAVPEWGRWLIGDDHRLRPRQMREVLRQAYRDPSRNMSSRARGAVKGLLSKLRGI